MRLLAGRGIELCNSEASVSPRSLFFLVCMQVFCSRCLGLLAHETRNVVVLDSNLGGFCFCWNIGKEETEQWQWRRVTPFLFSNARPFPTCLLFKDVYWSVFLCAHALDKRLIAHCYKKTSVLRSSLHLSPPPTSVLGVLSPFAYKWLHGFRRFAIKVQKSEEAWVLACS